MDTSSMTLRALGTFERALFLSDQHAPFNVVTVLRLDSPPPPEIIERALQVLQKRHPLLWAVIKEGKFEHRADASFPFKVIEQSDFNWLDGVEQEMNKRLIPERELCRGMYIVDKTSYAHLILTFHHTIMDASSGMNLLHELLQICSGAQEDKEFARHTLEVVPAVEKQFPASFKGLRGAAKMIRYALAQMAQEMGYQGRVRGKRIAPVHLGGRGFPLTLTLPESLVDHLSKCCRMKKVTLNS